MAHRLCPYFHQPHSAPKREVDPSLPLRPQALPHFIQLRALGRKASYEIRGPACVSTTVRFTGQAMSKLLNSQVDAQEITNHMLCCQVRLKALEMPPADQAFNRVAAEIARRVLKADGLFARIRLKILSSQNVRRRC
jgi:hypothetical protein